MRNRVVVLSVLGLTTSAARRIARQVPGALLVAMPYGRGQFGDDRAMAKAMLTGLGRNPNAATVLPVRDGHTPVLDGEHRRPHVVRAAMRRTSSSMRRDRTILAQANAPESG